jgi:electron transfer flavoprotein beta subunit
MKTLVCMKQVLDPDVPARDFQIDPEKKEAKVGAANLVTDIFSENALETALQLRQADPGEITALCYGGEKGEDVLRKALAMTADHAVLVERQGNTNPDPETVAKVLAAAIKKLGAFDLILVGRESGDWGVGQTGGLLAAELGFPYLSLVDRIEPAGGGLRLRRQTDVGFEVAECAPPVLLTITNSESNVPRIPKTRDVMMSYRKPLQKWSVADLGLDAAAAGDGRSFYEVVELYVPKKDVKCEFVEGDSLEDKVAAFARKVAEVVNAVG